MLDNEDVAMACAPTPLASTTAGGSDGTSCTWGIAMKLGANEAFDALECCHLAGHRWAWFAGGARSWRRDFEFHVQNKLAEHLNTHQPDADDEVVTNALEEVSNALWMRRGNLAHLKKRAKKTASGEVRAIRAISGEFRAISGRSQGSSGYRNSNGSSPQIALSSGGSWDVRAHRASTRACRTTSLLCSYNLFCMPGTSRPVHHAESCLLIKSCGLEASVS